MNEWDGILFRMMLIPALSVIATGIIIQIIAAIKKKSYAVGPVLIAAGIVFSAVSLITIFAT